MASIDPRDVEFWHQPLCDRDDCHRGGPHFPGEYGCVRSNVWRTPEGVSQAEPCPTYGNHRRGCGCPGDPIQGAH